MLAVFFWIIIGMALTWAILHFIIIGKPIFELDDKDCPIDVDYFIGLIKNGTVEYQTYKSSDGQVFFYMSSPDYKIKFAVCEDTKTYCASDKNNFWIYINGKEEYFSVSLIKRNKLLLEMKKARRQSIISEITELQLQQAKEFIDRHSLETKAKNTNKKL